MPLIDYKKLRAINPETARMAVWEYLSGNGGNVSSCAKTFGITRRVVYDIVRRSGRGALKDLSRAPKRIRNKTPDEIRELVLRLHTKHGFSARQIEAYFRQNSIVKLPYGTIRHIIARNH